MALALVKSTSAVGAVLAASTAAFFFLGVLSIPVVVVISVDDAVSKSLSPRHHILGTVVDVSHAAVICEVAAISHLGLDWLSAWGNLSWARHVHSWAHAWWRRHRSHLWGHHLSPRWCGDHGSPLWGDTGLSHAFVVKLDGVDKANECQNGNDRFHG